MEGIDCEIHLFKTRKDAVGEVLGLINGQSRNIEGCVFPCTEIEPDNRWMAEAIRSHRAALCLLRGLTPIFNPEKALL